MDREKLSQKLDRIARQIYEHNFEEKRIALIGISERGHTLAKRLKERLDWISTLESLDGSLKLDKDDPLRSEIKVSIVDKDLENTSVLLVDDVLNSGKTLMHAAKQLMNIPIKKLTTIVLVDRKHRKYPIKADFVGMTLATTLKDHIRVRLGDEDEGAYLE
ncbi:MAG: phosphoribosyltransferase family protein [Flavobacteriales bacterium]